ncbi:hypothetical protein EGW08_020289 [Elysia chlorotica]|uniref:SWI/SNF complex subunit SMARCC2 n=1 Tax=Elysia chlorotica TaxID=188477 RepID=A0A433SRP1_ELYCH|nr:hypothetical protein EGW08_020289 [Elysia chlorotica]
MEIKMALQRKKDGGPNTKFFDSQETIAQFDPVRTWLLKNCKKYVQADPPTNKNLANLLVQLLQFQEEAFGRQVTNPALTKLPMKSFLEFKPGSSLCQIFQAVFKFKSEQGWRRFDFSSPSRMDRNVEMFLQVEKALVASKAFVPPQVYIAPEVDKQMATQLRDIVKSHQGTVVETREEATHAVLQGPTQTTTAGADSEARCATKIFLQLLTPYSQVSPRWILDLEQYNEWMNEEDYIIEEESRRQKKTNTKRKRSPSPPPEKIKRKSSRAAAIGASKKRKWEEDEEDITKDLEDPPPETNITEVHNPKQGSSSRSVKDEFTPVKGGTIMDLDEEQADKPSVNGTGATSAPSEDGVEKRESSAEAGDDSLTEQTHHIIVPSYSAWFDYNSVHAIERRALPEFFNGKNKSKTPEIYAAYRNFMIDTYRLNPTEYLTSTAVRRNLAGDVCCIMRVHAFLEQWGLINYQVDADSHPTAMGPPSTSHFHILADTPSGIASINPPRVNQPSAAQEICDFGDKKKDEAEDRKELTSVGLKTDIYTKKMAKDKPPSMRTREWSDQETLLLLEALELYKDDWNKVCEHVGSRTQDECILHFLRLPIEDPFLEEDDGHLGPLVYQPIPFSKAGNPIMSTVAFLASVVDPRVASAAAKAALEEFSKMKDEVPPAIVDAHSKAVAQATKEGKTVEPTFGLDKTGIAGTEVVEEPKEALDKEGEKKDNEEPMETDSSKEKSPKVKEEKEKEKSDKAEEKKESEDAKKDKTPASENGSKKSEEESGSTEKSGENNATEKPKEDDPASVVSTAAAAALSAAAVKAKHLAAVEERKIKGLVALLVETQMKKLEIKLRHFEELETIMDKERESLEYQRQLLLQERQQFHMEQIRAAEYRARQFATQQVMETNAPTPPPHSSSSAAPSPQPSALSNSGATTKPPGSVPTFGNGAPHHVAHPPTSSSSPPLSGPLQHQDGAPPVLSASAQNPTLAAAVGHSGAAQPNAPHHSQHPGPGGSNGYPMSGSPLPPQGPQVQTSHLPPGSSSNSSHSPLASATKAPTPPPPQLQSSAPPSSTVAATSRPDQPSPPVLSAPPALPTPSPSVTAAAAESLPSAAVDTTPASTAAPTLTAETSSQQTGVTPAAQPAPTTVPQASSEQSQQEAPPTAAPVSSDSGATVSAVSTESNPAQPQSSSSPLATSTPPPSTTATTETAQKATASTTSAPSGFPSSAPNPALQSSSNSPQAAASTPPPTLTPSGTPTPHHQQQQEQQQPGYPQQYPPASGPYPPAGGLPPPPHQYPPGGAPPHPHYQPYPGQYQQGSPYMGQPYPPPHPQGHQPTPQTGAGWCSAPSAPSVCPSGSPHPTLDNGRRDPKCYRQCTTWQRSEPGTLSVFETPPHV